MILDNSWICVAVINDTYLSNSIYIREATIIMLDLYSVEWHNSSAITSVFLVDLFKIFFISFISTMNELSP